MVRAPSSIKPAAGLRPALLARDQERRSERARMVKAASHEPTRRNDLMPRLQLVERDLATLSAPARNVRALDAAHIREVAHAIGSLGFSVPVLIDQTGAVLDGLVRLEAAKLLGLPSVPCVIAKHLSPKERKLLRLAVNKLGEKGAWNLPELKLELEELMIDEAPIEIIGFDETEIDGILMDDDAVAAEPGPVAPEADASPVARPGDIFRLGRHRVICGDAHDGEVLRTLMGADVARMVFTDQPYNVAIAGHVTSGPHREFAMASGEMSDAGFAAFNAAWIAAALAHLIEGGVLATFIDWRGLGSVTSAAFNLGLSQINLVVWGKTNAGMGSLYRSQHELLPLFKKGSAEHINNVELGRKGRHRSNLWSYPGASSLGSDARQGLQHHPTVKPVAMLSDALYDLTNRGDVVLDPFLGSGSTLMAAENTGRTCLGVELDPLYVDLIVRRYEQVTGQPAVLDATNETYLALAHRRHAEAGSACSDERSANSVQEQASVPLEQRDDKPRQD